MPFSYDEVWNALEESVKLQSHYAQLLNMYDNGSRMYFLNANDWLYRLRHLEREKEKLEKQLNK